MAERVLSMHEVAGSMPASSTQTATLRGEYRVPSDPRSQAPSGPVSTIVGDQIGSPGAVCSRMCCRLVGPMDKVSASEAGDSGFESRAGLARFYASRNDTVAERLRRWTRNPLGFSRMSSNLIGVGCGSMV